MTFYFLDNVLSLYLSLKPPKRVFEGFTLLKSNFRQRTTPPTRLKMDLLVMASIGLLSQVDCERIFMNLRNLISLKLAFVEGQTNLRASGKS